MSGHGGPDKSYFTHAVVITAFTLAMGVFAFILVIHHRSIPDRIQEVHQSRYTPHPQGDSRALAPAAMPVTTADRH